MPRKNVTSRREGLRNRNRVDYNHLANLKVNKLIQLPNKTHTPEHVGEALNSDIRNHYIDCLFNCSDKMHNSETLTFPFARTRILEGKKVLLRRLLFKAKLTDVIDCY